MTMKRTLCPRDPVQLGKLMVDIITGQAPDPVDDGKDAGAVRTGKTASLVERATPNTSGLQRHTIDSVV